MSGPRVSRVGRGGGSAQIGSRFTPATFWLCLVEVALFLVYAFTPAGPLLHAHAALTPGRALFGLELWQPLTAIFVHTEPFALLMNALALWLFFPAIDRMLWGGRRLVVAFIATGAVGYAAATAVGAAVAPMVTLGGCSPSILAGLAAFGLAYPRLPVQFFGVVPVRLGALAAFLVGLALFVSLAGGRWVELAADAGAVLTGGLLVWRGQGRLRLGDLRARLRTWRVRRKYRVIQGGRDKHWLN